MGLAFVVAAMGFMVTVLFLGVFFFSVLLFGVFFLKVYSA